MSNETKPNLFPPPPYCRKFDKGANKCIDEIPPISLEASNPAKLLQLLENLQDDNSKMLEVKVNRYLKQESEAVTVFLINTLAASEEAVVQTVNDTILDNPIRLPLSEETINGFIKYQNRSLPTDPDVINPQISIMLNEILNNIPEKLFLIPILGNVKNDNGHNHKNNKEEQKIIAQPVLIVCFVNSPKLDGHIIKLVEETFRYCLSILINTLKSEEESRKKKQCQSLLMVARKLFSHLSDLNDLLKEIMSEARRLTNAERCSLFLLDPDHMHLVAKVFDGVSSSEADQEVKIAKDQGIAGHVAATGKLLNIKNAYEHPLFYKGMDEATGFKTRNILCFPICDEINIIGVAQLCNKKGGNFDYFDEEIANAFSIYCGLSIMHSLVYKEIQEAQARSKLSNEMMMYHMKVSDDDISRVINCPSPHYHPQFDNFNFSPRTIIVKETICFVLKMMKDLEFLEKFDIKTQLLVRFLLFVQKGYRNTPYHNWMHAFSVTHFAYLCLKNFRLIENGYLTHLEALAYFISCLCHDIDHRGTTNSFQLQSDSVLASLYSSEGSVMEHHHLSQTICTLNTEGCNFLESLKKEDYILCLDLIKEMILATDLATHFKIYQKQSIMVESGYDPNNIEHKNSLLCMLMTCADLSDQTKQWALTKRVAQLIYDEFFTQGDLEKKMGRTPSKMMDREHAYIPDLQLEFLNDVCLPVFKLLAKLFDNANQLVESLEQNIMCWETSKNVFQRYMDEGRTSVDILNSDDLEKGVLELVDGHE